MGCAPVCGCARLLVGTMRDGGFLVGSRSAVREVWSGEALIHHEGVREELSSPHKMK